MNDNTATPKLNKRIGMLGGLANDWAVTIAFVFGLLGLLTYMALCVIMFLSKNSQGEFDYFVRNGHSKKPMFIGGHVILFLSMLILFYSKKNSVNGMMRKVGEMRGSELYNGKMKYAFGKQIFNTVVSIVSSRRARDFILWILFLSSFFLLLLNTVVGEKAPDPVSYIGSFTPTVMIVVFCWIYIYCQIILDKVLFSTEPDINKQFPLQNQRNYKTMKWMKHILLIVTIFSGSGFVVLDAVKLKELAVFFQLVAILTLCMLGIIMCWDHTHAKTYITDDEGYKRIPKTTTSTPPVAAKE